MYCQVSCHGFYLQVTVSPELYFTVWQASIKLHKKSSCVFYCFCNNIQSVFFSKGICVTEWCNTAKPWRAPCSSIKNDSLSLISCWISLFLSRAFLLSAAAINTLCPVKVRPHCVRPYPSDENELWSKHTHRNTDFTSNRVSWRWESEELIEFIMTWIYILGHWILPICLIFAKVLFVVWHLRIPPHYWVMQQVWPSRGLAFVGTRILD